MNLTSLAPTVGPTFDRVATQRQLNDLALDMTRGDAELTDAVHDRNRVGAGWDTWFNKISRQMLDASDAYGQLVPDDTALASRMRADALDLAESAGELGSAYRRGNTFGSGWDATLDNKISDARLAADRLATTVPAPTPTPGPGAPSAVASDAARAADLLRQSIDRIKTVPSSDTGDASTKDARIGAFNLNTEAQKVIEQHFSGGDAAVTSQLRTADAHMEDANWQLAKKPSPDGRFNGVDIPGALRDSDAALAILEQLATASNT